MANKIYCMACGSPSLYDSSPPKFCGNCGQTIVKSSTAQTVRTSPQTSSAPLATTIPREVNNLRSLIQNREENEDQAEYQELLELDLNVLKNSFSTQEIKEHHRKPTVGEIAMGDGDSREEAIQDRKAQRKGFNKKKVLKEILAHQGEVKPQSKTVKGRR